MSGETKDKELFTQREVEIMAVAWTCFEGDPKLNYSKLAKTLGMTNDKSANNAWAKIKKKLQARADELAGDTLPTNGKDGDARPVKTPKTPKTPASGKKRGKKAGSPADGADEDEETPTKQSPTKKFKKTAATKEVKAENEENDDAVKNEMELL